MVADELTCAARSTAELNAAAFTSFRCDGCLQLKRHGHGQHCAARRRCKKCIISTHFGTHNSVSLLSLLRESSWIASARRALAIWPGADGRRRHRRSQSVPACASARNRYVFADIHHLGLDPPCIAHRLSAASRASHIDWMAPAGVRGVQRRRGTPACNLSTLGLLKVGRVPVDRA